MDTWISSDVHGGAMLLVYSPSAICPTARVFVCSLNWFRRFEMDFLVTSLILSFQWSFLLNWSLSPKAFSFGLIFYQLEMKKTVAFFNTTILSEYVLHFLLLLLINYPFLNPCLPFSNSLNTANSNQGIVPTLCLLLKPQVHLVHHLSSRLFQFAAIWCGSFFHCKKVSLLSIPSTEANATCFRSFVMVAHHFWDQ